MEATLAGLVSGMSELAFDVLTYHLVKELESRQHWNPSDPAKPSVAVYRMANFAALTVARVTNPTQGSRDGRASHVKIAPIFKVGLGSAHCYAIELLLLIRWPWYT